MQQSTTPLLVLALCAGAAQAGAIHHWSFDSGDISGLQDTTGALTAFDTIGNADATLETSGGEVGGATFSSTVKKFGDGGLNLPDFNDRARIAEINQIVLSAEAEDAWSISFWANPYDANRVIIGDTDQGQDALWWRDNVTDPRVQIRDISGAANFIFTGANIVADEWHHVVVTRDGETWTGYLNGVAVTTSGSQLQTWEIDTLGGGRGDNTTQNFSGGLDEVWIFDHALSQEEVNSLFTSNEAGSSGGTPSLALTITPNSGNYNFAWESQNGKVYNLVSATELITPTTSWPVWQGQEGIAGTAPTNTLTNILGGGDPARFFAVLEMDPLPLLEENFDAAAALPAGWATSGPSNGTEWEIGDPGGGPASGPSAANSAPNCAGTNITGTYTGNADVSLISPSLAVPAGSGASLSFWQLIDTDLAGDVGSVRVLDADNADTPIPGLEILNIEGLGTDGWSEQTLDLPAADVGDKNIKIEFRFVSNADLDLWSGFYIDDVVVHLASP